MELTCPKCHGPMRTYERNGVHVDQCADCRGIFLDRGELERLIDAENAWHDQDRAGRSSSASSYSSSSGHAGAGGGLGAVVNEVLGATRGHKSSSYSHGYDEYGRPYGHGHPKRKKSFLDQLFD
ncbi:TFIIB-type zinc ribbon-containing protein [Geodermatophilus sp. URMC 64]